MIGTRLGPYEITAKLGEGGMGEVYRATDSKLHRDVAIKVLPAAFTEDKERLARFEREAQLLAQLHHPHIASIFGLEESEGTKALVMELVEGPTLADRLEKGALLLEESLSIARQIAEALEEAHEKGIVHRDLKPQNIKAAIDGKVKVLDFGLAKAMDPTAGASGGASASQLAASPTLTLGATVQGMILGTAAYMAPEQARGTAVDQRADVWAFGVVLYEMLSGRTAFASETVPDTLAAVLTRELDWSALPETTPPAIRRLLRRCLTRKPKDRLHHVADARIVIEEVLRGEREEMAAPAAPVAAARRPAWLLPGAAALALAAGLSGGWLLRGTPEAALPELEMALALPPDTYAATGNAPALAISPDGRRQVVVAADAEGRSRLLLRDLGQVDPRPLPGTENAYGPFFSPDGESIGCALGSGLFRAALAGGPLLQLAEVSGDYRGATWSRDGFVYFSPAAASPLLRVAENGGAAQPVTELDGARSERTHRWPDALPDGSAVLFTSDTSASSEFYDDARIEAVRPATGERTVVLEGASQARFLAPDQLVFARGGSLFAVRFDPRTLATRGAAVPVVHAVSTEVSSGAVHFDLADSGAAAWIPGAAITGKRRLEWVEPDGAVRPLDLPLDRYAQIALSPDGGRLAVTIDTAAGSDLWVVDLGRGTRNRLTFAGTVTDLTWTPDGRRVAYAGAGAGAANDIFWTPADGSGEAELLLGRAGDQYPSSFTPDGKGLVHEHREPAGTHGDVHFVVPGGPSRPLLDAPFEEHHPALSADGRWLAYVSGESAAREEIFVRRFPELTGKWQASLEGGTEPHWAPEGDALYYRRDGRLLRVAVDTSTGFAVGPPAALSEGMVRGGVATSYSVARGGRVLVYRDERPEQEGRQVNLALGFAARARRLLAPKR